MATPLLLSAAAAAAAKWKNKWVLVVDRLHCVAAWLRVVEEEERSLTKGEGGGGRGELSRARNLRLSPPSATLCLSFEGIKLVPQVSGGEIYALSSSVYLSATRYNEIG